MLQKPLWCSHCNWPPIASAVVAPQVSFWRDVQGCSRSVLSPYWYRTPGKPFQFCTHWWHAKPRHSSAVFAKLRGLAPTFKPFIRLRQTMNTHRFRRSMTISITWQDCLDAGSITVNRLSNVLRRQVYGTIPAPGEWQCVCDGHRSLCTCSASPSWTCSWGRTQRDWRRYALHCSASATCRGSGSIGVLLVQTERPGQSSVSCSMTWGN